MSDDDELPPHHSPVRALWAEGHGEPYAPLATLEEARAVPDAAVVMEGDYGGQIYLTCPVRHVACDEVALRQLLDDLNALAWADGEGLYYERLPIGSGVTGGMGGGVVIDGVWLHEDLLAQGMLEAVRAVLAGRLARIGAP